MAREILLVIKTVVLAAALLAPAAGLSAGEPAEPKGHDDRPAAEPAPRGTGGGAELEVTPQAALAIRRALDFLAGIQNKDGSWDGQGNQHRAAMTGLSGLAFLSAGHVPGKGKHGKAVEKAVNFLLRLQDREGCYADSGGRSMHGHGYALHFMAEAYGTTADPDLSRRLRKSVTEGVRLTARCQSPEGGWIYQPVAQGHEGSITVTQVQALWAARQAGINVPQKTIDKGIDYMRKSQQPDGGICYRLGMPGSRPALSAAGVMVFCGLGLRESREATKAIGYLRRMLSGGAGQFSVMGGFPHYTDLYVGQALYQAGDPEWSRHYPRFRDEILKCQAADGSISRGGDGYGPAFSTSCEVLVLAIPYQYLPTFQR